MEKVNQRGKYLFIAGIISLIIAIVILFIIPDPSANNVEIAKKATSAVQAAQEISKNNQSSILMHTIGMGLLGFGITGTVGGFILKSFKKNNRICHIKRCYYIPIETVLTVINTIRMCNTFLLCI